MKPGTRVVANRGRHEGTTGTVVSADRHAVTVEVDDESMPCRACRQPVPRTLTLIPDAWTPLDLFTGDAR